MYKVCIYNDNVETTIHYPSENKESPHLNKINIKEGINAISSFSFTILINNIGYNLINEFKTKIKIIDLRDNTIRFSGRVLSTNEKMSSNGEFYKEATCENALAYLLDTNIRNNTYLTDDISSMLSDLLNKHNEKVEDNKKIYLGNVSVTGSISYTTNYESTYNAIANALSNLTYYLQIREESGLLYLDCLNAIGSTPIDVVLGKNMKEMVKTIDVTDMGTRIIPLGANNLTIESANGGIDYIEDSIARDNYGIIEKPVTYSDITDANELKIKAVDDISNYTQPKITFEINALDLSYITNTSSEKFKTGSRLHIINPIMGIDDLFNITEVDLDLFQPYNPKLTISNVSIKLSSALVAMQQSSVQNNGVYNNVQVGDAFGIRAVRSDGKVITTLNATEGISIENENQKVFFVDENGNLVANDATFNDVTANNMIANLMRTSNTSNYTVLHDQYLDFYNNLSKLGSIGYAPDPLFNGGEYDFGLITPRCSFTVYPGSGGFDLRSEGWNYFWGNCDFRGQVKSNGYNVATMQHISSLENTIEDLQQRVFLLEQAVY